MALFNISTHALTEGDLTTVRTVILCFISTHALTEGDEQVMKNPDLTDISTHALTEGDYVSSKPFSSHILYFNSRPHGGRLPQMMCMWSGYVFQLTPSRRATAYGLEIIYE